MNLIFAAVSMLLYASPVTIHGRVLDSRTGEPIAKAMVSIREQKLEVVTDSAGSFIMPSVVEGEVELYVTTVGYGLIKKKLQIESGADTELEVYLSQEALKRSEEITVTASAFEPIEANSASERTLNNTELKNLAGVLIDDPLRSVQTLPGVATSDDFNPDFAVRGLGFETVGFYLDGVLTHSPFHAVRDTRDGGGLTILNGDVVESVSLVSGAPSSKYGDRIGAVLNVQTRDGNRERFSTRINASITGFSFTSEGPIGKSKKSSWLLSARKSYLDYVIHHVVDDPTFVFSYRDVQGKASFNPSERHQVSLTVIAGDSGLNRDNILDRLGINGLRDGNSTTQIYKVNWRWIPTGATVLQSVAFVSGEDADNLNPTREPLFNSRLRHIGLRQDLTYQLNPRHKIESGYSVRRFDENATRRRFDFSTNQFRTNGQFTGRTWQPGGYVQDTLSAWNNRLTITAGIRVDRFAQTSENVVLPHASSTLALSQRTQLTAGFGQYAQFPTLKQLAGDFKNPLLQSQRATHYVMGLERMLTAKTRVRIEAYDEELKNFIFSPATEWRLVGNRILPPDGAAMLENRVAGHSRGVEFFVQRRSANNLSGWISYSYGVTRLRDDRAGLHFDGDFDQRHTFNAYGSHRLSKTLNISLKYRYGSGFPIPGYYRAAGNLFFISDKRNEARAPVYSRLDVRLNKAFFHDRWKLTLYGEVVNVLNREHIQYTELDGIDRNTGQIFLDYNTLLPIIPTAGITIEF